MRRNASLAGPPPLALLDPTMCERSTRSKIGSAGFVAASGTLRRLALLSAVALASLVASTGSGLAPAGGPRAALHNRTEAPVESLLGILAPPNGAASTLVRLDPLSLARLSKRVPVGEYHDAWSPSPDRSQLALGISAPSIPAAGHRRVGIRIVDLRRMRVVRDVETGIAATALGWLTPRRLVAALLSGGIVLVDPATGRTLRRWPLASVPGASARTRQCLLVLLPDPIATRLALIDGGGRLRLISLAQIRIEVRETSIGLLSERAGLAVDTARERAYVFAGDAPVAEVDLRTMQVRYRELQSLHPGARRGLVGAGTRDALWLGNGLVAVSGLDLAPTPAGKVTFRPAGVTLVDTASWSTRTIDAEASAAAFAAGRILAYAARPPGSRTAPFTGLRAYTLEGRELFRLFQEEQVWSVRAAAGHAYVRTPQALRVIELGSETVVRDVQPAPELYDVIGESP